MMRPTWSPTVIGSSHQPSAHARMPRSRHVRAYSARRSLRAPRHRRQRVADQVRRVLEGRELGAVLEQIAHARSLDPHMATQACREGHAQPQRRYPQHDRFSRLRVTSSKRFFAERKRPPERCSTVPEMATPRREQGPGYFHVYTVATGGAGALRRRPRPPGCWFERLGRIAAALGWRVFAYTLLTTHYHAVLQTRDANLSRGMQWLNAGHVQLYNQRWTRSGTLVARRFGYRVIEARSTWGRAATSG